MVIHDALQFLRVKVNSYNNNVSPIVEIMNISGLNDGDQFVNSTTPIILSVVNIEHDKTAKNPNTYLPYTSQGNTVKKYKNPAQNLIISLLFSAYAKEKETTRYEDGIKKLEHVIRCLQEQDVFYINGTTEVDPGTENHTKLILDMESLKISELNQLWSILGNKYMPSVLYKMRMISIQHEDSDGGRVIEKAKIKLWNNNPGDIAGQIEESDDIILNN